MKTEGLASLNRQERALDAAALDAAEITESELLLLGVKAVALDAAALDAAEITESELLLLGVKAVSTESKQ